MELRLLQYFLAVAQEGNISRAAEVLHVTQPTLSRQMTQLENEVGSQLFIRGRHIVLTEAGVLLQRRAEEVIKLIKKIDTDFIQAKELEGTISIGSGGLYSTKFLLDVLEGFHKEHPKVKFQLYTNSADYIKEQLQQGVLDFGLLLEPIDITAFDYIRMKDKEQWGLLLRKDNPLAEKKYITKEDIWQEKLITSDRIIIQKELLQWIGRPASDLDIFATYNILAQAAGIVDSGIASALTIEGAVSMMVSDKLIFKPLQPELAMTSVFVWKKWLPTFGLTSAFLSYFKSKME